MTEEQLATDVDVVARAEIVAAIEYDVSVGHISHESCPDIGASDWKLVEGRITEIMRVVAPSDDVRMDSYGRLLDRCERNE
jgi:hypothetical protein